MRTPPAKFLVPQRLRTHLARDRLAAPVIQASDVRLVSVQAPAGFGKTNTMLDIHAACVAAGMRTAWCQLGAADNDFSIFLASLNVAVDALCEGNEDVIAAGQDGLPTDTLVDRLTRFPVPFAIFLDDFEALHNPAALEFLRQLIGQMPAHGKFVVGSRGTPELGLGRLRAHGRLLEITTDALRFTLEETGAYLRERIGQSVSKEDLRKLHLRTEGWVVAIWLAVLAMQRCEDVSAFIGTFSGSDAAVADYLAEDVLSRQSPEVQDFLLKTSLLGPFSAELCNAVTGRGDGTAMLERLAHENLFLTSLDAAGQWYRYHSLFSDFLKARLAQLHGGVEIARLHRLASEWFVGQGRPVPAIEHALKAEDFCAALDLLQQHADPLLWQGRVRLLARWFECLPPDSLSNRPRLRLVQAWALTFLHRGDKALRMLEDMRDAGERDAEIAAHMLALHAFILALGDKLDQAYAAWQDCLRKLSPSHVFPYGVQLNSLASCHIYLGHFEQARRMLDSSRQVHAGIGGGANMRVAHCLDGSIDLVQGRLRQALTRYRGAHEPDASRGEQRVDGQEIAGAFLAEALYESGRSDQAQRLLSAYLPLIREAAYIDPLIVTFVLLCRGALADGREEDAMLWLHDCEQMGYRTGLLRMVANARLERSRIAVQRGDRDGAELELAAARALRAWSFGPEFVPHANDVETVELAHCRLEIAFGNPAGAAQALREALALAQAAQRGRRALKLRILLATALQAAGDSALALQELAPALEFGASEGFVSTFIDEGEPVARMIGAVGAGGTRGGPQLSPAARALVAQLAGMFAERSGAAPKGAVPAMANAHPVQDGQGLTKKELKVLHLLADGMANKEMAVRLFVSETTVKTHLRSINAKLGASSRTHAVAVARKLGLIA